MIPSTCDTDATHVFQCRFAVCRAVYMHAVMGQNAEHNLIKCISSSSSSSLINVLSLVNHLCRFTQHYGSKDKVSV